MIVGAYKKAKSAVIIYYIMKIITAGAIWLYCYQGLENPEIPFIPIIINSVLETIIALILKKATTTSVLINVPKSVFIWNWVHLIGAANFGILIFLHEYLPIYIKIALLVLLVFPGLVLEPFFTGETEENNHHSASYRSDSLKVQVKILRISVGVTSFLACIRLCFGENVSWSVVLLPGIYGALVFFFLGIFFIFNFLCKLLSSCCSSCMAFKQGSKKKNIYFFRVEERNN